MLLDREQYPDLAKILQRAVLSTDLLNNWELKFLYDMADRFEMMGERLMMSPKQIFYVAQIGMKLGSLNRKSPLWVLSDELDKAHGIRTPKVSAITRARRKGFDMVNGSVIETDDKHKIARDRHLVRKHKKELENAKDRANRLARRNRELRRQRREEVELVEDALRAAQMELKQAKKEAKKRKLGTAGKEIQSDRPEILLDI